MKKMKKTIAMLMVYLMAVTLLPIGGFTTIANAEENIPKYSKTTDLYFTNVFQYKDKSLVSYTTKKNEYGYISHMHADTISLFDNGQEKYIEKETFTGPVYFNGANNFVTYERYGINSNYDFNENHYKQYNFDTDKVTKFDDSEIKKDVKEIIAKKLNVSINYNYGYLNHKYILDNNNNTCIEFNLYDINTKKSYCGVYNKTGIEFIRQGLNHLDGVSFNKDGSFNFVENTTYQDNKLKINKVKDNEIVSTKEIVIPKNIFCADVKTSENRVFLMNADYPSYKNISIYEYWLEGNQYKEKSSYKLASSIEYGSERMKFKKDCNNNIWLLQDENNHRYVCKIEDGKAVKKYEVEPYMDYLYVYDDDNIVVTSQKGSTIINAKNNTNPPVEEDKKVETKPVVTPGEKETKVEVKEKLTPNATNVVKADNVKGKAEVILTDIDTIKNENGAIEVTINGNETVKVPFAAISKNIPEGAKSVTVTLSTEENSDILKGLNAVGKVYNFDLTVEDKDGNKTSIHNFAEGTLAEITLTLTDEDMKNMDLTKAVVYYYNEETKKLEPMETSINGNKVTFKTPHFSKYIIAEKINDATNVDGNSGTTANTSNSSAVSPKTGDTNNIAMLVAIAAISLIGVLVITKKNLKSSEK